MRKMVGFSERIAIVYTGSFNVMQYRTVQHIHIYIVHIVDIDNKQLYIILLFLIIRI